MTRRDPQATREAILEAAADVFAERGFAGTATSELAKRAGVTKSLIHHHFGSKDGLWQTIKEREFKTYYDAQLAMLQSDAEPSVELLLDSLRVYFEFLHARPRFVRMLQWMFIEDATSCEDLGLDLFALGVERLEAAQALGLVSPTVSPAGILMSFFALVEHWFIAGQSLSTKFRRADLTSEQYLNDILRLTRRALTA